MPTRRNSPTHGPRANRRLMHLISFPAQWVPAMQASTRSSNNKTFAQPLLQCHTHQYLRAHHQCQRPMATRLTRRLTCSICRRTFLSLNFLDPPMSKGIHLRLPPSVHMRLRQRHMRAHIARLRNHSNQTRLDGCLIREHLLYHSVERAANSVPEAQCRHHPSRSHHTPMPSMPPEVWSP